MKIPKGMTEEELIAVIDKIASRLAYKFRFGYYGIEDMKQEARMEAWKGLEKWDGIRPIENFLWTHVRNRLFNLKRNQFERPDKPCLNCPLKAYIEETDGCAEYTDLMECKWYAGWIKRNSSKKNIMTPIEFEGVNDEKEKNMRNSDGVLSIEHQEIIDIIDDNLPVSLRHLWLKLQQGIKLPKPKIAQLREAIVEILEERGIDVEETWEI